MSPARIERHLRRAVPVAVVVGALQAVVLGLGWFVVYQHTHEQVAAGIEDVIVRANVAAAEAVMEGLGGTLDVGAYGSDSWQRAQDLVERLELGGSGFACILDPEGNVLCHPDLREQPSLRQVNMGRERLISLDGADETQLLAMPAGRIVTGVLTLLFDGRHYIATRRDADTGISLLVHQPVSGLTAASDQVTAGLVARMVVVGGVVIGLTALLAILFMRVHDRALKRWNQALEERVSERTSQLTRTHRALIFGIAKLSEYRDNETGKHVERMCAYSRVLATELAQRGAPIDENWIESLEMAASLHDIGKVAIPDSILLKPARLTPTEFEVMKTHAAAGAEALEAVREHVDDTTLLDMGIDIAGGHHERWDGSGYPRGLSGAKIPLSARIVAVADVFDALMSKRVYKEPIPFEEVCSMIASGSGEHFDPDVTAAFDAVARDLLAIHSAMQDVEDLPAIGVHQENSAVTSEVA